jgi:phosphatidylglycerophosphate synthase
MPFAWQAANLLSAARLLLVPALWALALLGEGRLVGLGLLIAGGTDYLDGHLARRLHQESRQGARLDSLADNVLLLSAALWLELLHPEILRENLVLVGASFGVYALSLSLGLMRFHQLANMHLYSSKVAGGLLYGFTVITLVTGTYPPVLLWLAAGTFIVSSSETLVAQLLCASADENMGSLLLIRSRRLETRTIHDSGRTRKQRSHAPQSANLVSRRASATSSVPADASPNQSDIRS